MSDPSILHVVPSLALDRGGPSRSVMGLAAAQAALGAQVTLIAGNSSEEAKSFLLNGVRVLHGRCLPTGFSIPGPRLAQTLSDEIAHHDIVHLHSVWNGIISLAAYQARRQRRRYVMCPRGMLDAYNLQDRPFRKRLWSGLIDRPNLAEAAGWHFLDQAEAANCVRPHSVSPAEIMIAPNGVEAERIERSLTDGPLQDERHEIRLVFLGRLHPIKGLELQIDAVAQLAKRGRRVRLTLVGPDDGAGRELKTRARRLSVEKMVEFAGPVYGDERYALLRGANAVLLTSHYECNSVTAAETMAAGGLLVATTACNLDRAAANDAVVLVPRDPVRLADEVIARIENPDLDREVRSNARRYAREALSWPSIARDSLSFYEKLMKAPR